MWPWKNMSFRRACEWSLRASFYCTMTSFRKSLPDPKLLTPAQAANVLALQNAMLWFGAAGAGPALLAIMLKGRGRIRRALACVGLASTVANHCILSWIMGVTLVTDPNDDELLVTAPKHELLVTSVLLAMVFVLLAVVDVKASLVLLGPPGAGGEEEEE